MRWRGRVGAVAVAAVAACQGSSRTSTGRRDGGVAPGDAAVPEGRIEGDVITLPAPPIELPRQESFRVLAPGAAPRRALRYAWKPGEREVTAAARIRSRQLVDGRWSEPVAAPAEQVGFAVSTVIGADHATLVLRGLPGAGNEDGPWRTLVAGQDARVSITARGQLGAPALADPGSPRAAAAADEITQRWLAAAVPLPDEPVGKGARWRVVTVLRSGGTVVKQTAEYTLVAARGTAWVIDALVRRVGETQTVVPDGLPRGSAAELVAFFREVKGRVTVGRDLPWPRAGALKAEVRVHARIAIPGRPVAEHITEDIGDVTLTAK